MIHVKIYKASMATKQNTKKLDFVMIKSFGHQGPKVVRVLREMAVSVFEHLDITTWKGIDQMWMFFGKVLKVSTLKNLEIHAHLKGN